MAVEYETRRTTTGAGSRHFGNGLGEVPIGELIGEFSEEAKRFVRAETYKAKEELRHEAKKAAAGGGLFAGAGVIGHAALFCLCAALVIGLGHLIGFGWSALLVGVVLAIVAAALAMSGKKAINSATKAPTLREQVREDKAWLRDTTRTVKASRHVDA